MFATARRLYERTGLRPKDFQLAMLYDAFTPQVLTQLEAYQFCGVGEAYIHGMNNIAEAVRQLRGSAANQVPAIERALVSSGICAAALASD